MNENEPETEIPPTSAASGQIQAIAKDTVHKICSGQVVLSLAVAVKELVENSIDAGATLVEIKLKDQGLQGVDVSDNGCGVEESNLEGMTAKYHTSKIREFVDLLGVETFGFRGEALSSLCALSDMTIVTRHKSTDVALKIELDHEGKIKKRSPCARGVGTTVSLGNLFATLPVRRRDFTRNIKKEFTKMCHILQAYCLVTKGVRLICSNQTPKGAKSIVLQTHGAQDELANISAVFGAKQVADLVPLKSPFESGQLSEEGLRAELQSASEAADTTCTQFSAEDVERLNQADFQLEGYISSCRHGAGRSTRDRQFFYVNSRPCDPKNIAKVMNDVYHRYNGQQQPFIYLNIVTSRADVDVNLTPDKRQLLLNNEKILLLALKKSLLDTFGNLPSTFQMQNVSIVSMLEPKVKVEETTAITADLDEDDVPVSSSQRFMDVLTQWRRTGDTRGNAPTAPAKRRCEETEEIKTRAMKMQKIQDFLTQKESTKEAEIDEEETTKQEKSESSPDSSLVNLKQLEEESKAFDGMIEAKVPRIDCRALTPLKPCQIMSPKEAEIDEEETTKREKYGSSPDSSLVNLKQLEEESKAYDGMIGAKVPRIDCRPLTPLKPRQIMPQLKPRIIHVESKPAKEAEEETEEETEPTEENDDDHIEMPTRIEYDGDDNDAEMDAPSNVASGEMRTSLDQIKASLQAQEQQHTERKLRAKLQRLRFKSQINPSQNQNAEAELQKEITKADFARMQIIGQFNLGFIIVKLEDDLFIVDQHAADEKYNFETLQRSTQLEHQRLTVPQTLELTAVNEMVLLDHLPAFEKNGFRFEINNEAPATKKVRLLGKPFSKNWEFGKEDIDELIFMLQDAPEGTICRPSRIRAMFASRACRKSVMIGKALNRGTTMRRLITQMGEIEQPWNCPHGRPTMRHLINITMLLDAEADDNDNDGNVNECETPAAVESTFKQKS
ncbi:mismatch repair endonuclease PMS2 isoform X1 [Drosophila albomicans]|uniref:Mismatch repair endonuclease PMS2 isoform X1 n=1 Tax=Drosophila albomicans TaxID=7291 RepID=A0A6P8WFV5_DROAB|nr:mismatch repair endonuclease PMS2 isoform X1 [Drosophila albomicans]